MGGGKREVARGNAPLPFSGSDWLSPLSRWRSRVLCPCSSRARCAGRRRATRGTSSTSRLQRTTLGTGRPGRTRSATPICHPRRTRLATPICHPRRTRPATRIERTRSAAPICHPGRTRLATAICPPGRTRSATGRLIFLARRPSRFAGFASRPAGCCSGRRGGNRYHSISSSSSSRRWWTFLARTAVICSRRGLRFALGKVLGIDACVLRLHQCAQFLLCEVVRRDFRACLLPVDMD